MRATRREDRGAPAPRSSRARRLLLPVAGVLLFLLLWEGVSRSGIVNPQYLPPASSVLAVFVENLARPEFWAAVGNTAVQWLLGLIMAVVVGTVLGLVIGSSGFLRRYTSSTIEFLRPIPSVAFIPIAVLLFGVRIEAALLLIVYAAVWQVLIQVLYGVADADPVAVNTARSFGLGRLARVRYVVLPTTLPYLLTGVRLAASVALILAVTAGLTIGTAGLGAAISVARTSGAVVQMYALVLTTGLMGIVINILMRSIEKRTLGWHASVRSEVIT